MGPAYYLQSRVQVLCRARGSFCAKRPAALRAEEAWKDLRKNGCRKWSGRNPKRSNDMSEWYLHIGLRRLLAVPSLPNP